MEIIGFCIVLIGISGTILLGFSFSPQADQLNVGEPKELRKRIKWWIKEGSKRSVPFQFNPIIFYLGLFFVAFSIILSTISKC